MPANNKPLRRRRARENVGEKRSANPKSLPARVREQTPAQIVVMPYFTYDTSVIISRKITDLPDSFLMSAIVLLELTANAKDDSQRKLYERLFRQYRQGNSLIVPDDDDWLLASKVLYWLTHARKRVLKGKLKRLQRGASQRMALDVLIAVSARRWGATVITENWDDFKAIQRYCNTRVAKASDFFRA
jgi:predicted nucleic acid-binding protein